VAAIRGKGQAVRKEGGVKGRHEGDPKEGRREGGREGGLSEIQQKRKARKEGKKEGCPTSGVFLAVGGVDDVGRSDEAKAQEGGREGGLTSGVLTFENKGLSPLEK